MIKAQSTVTRPMADHRYSDKEWLKQQYIDEGHTLSEVGEKCGVDQGTVKYWVDKFDIPTRRMGYRPAEPEPYRDEGWLREKYLEEELSTADIGDLCDCSKETIRRWLGRHGLGTRSKSDAAKIRAERHPHTIDAGREALRDSPNWWDEATEEEREEFRQWLSSERMGEDNPMHGVTGDAHPQWKERTSPLHFYHSDRWNEVRAKAKDRDDHQCQSCGQENGEDHLLHVHHIEPISDGGPPFDLDNLVTLCPACHAAEHGGV